MTRPPTSRLLLARRYEIFVFDSLELAGAFAGALHPCLYEMHLDDPGRSDAKLVYVAVRSRAALALWPHLRRAKLFAPFQECPHLHNRCEQPMMYGRAIDLFRQYWWALRHEVSRRGVLLPSLD